MEKFKHDFEHKYNLVILLNFKPLKRKLGLV